jgi:hypothetical protein
MIARSQASSRHSCFALTLSPAMASHGFLRPASHSNVRPASHSIVHSATHSLVDQACLRTPEAGGSTSLNSWVTRAG